MTTWMSGTRVDEVDWAEIYRDNLPRVRSYVRGRVPAAWVDDTVQDTFVRAFRSRRRFDDSRPVWPWLVTIARRACIETCRAHPLEVVPFDIATHGTAALDDPHAELERGLQAQAIAGALHMVSPRHRHLLVSYEVQGQPFASLAEEERISRQALKSALCRARDSFRTHYATLAERRGLAALPIVGPVVARLRRWRRAFGMASLPIELAGMVVVGVGATALFVGVPVGPQASTAVAVGIGDDSLVAAVGAMPGPASVVDGQPAVAPAVLGDATAPPARRGDEQHRHPAIRAGGDAEVAFMPDRSTATIRLEWNSEELGGQSEASITLRCGGALWQTVCEVARATPAAD